MPNRTSTSRSFVADHRDFVLTRAAQIVSNTRNKNMSFVNLTNMVNRRFGTSYSVNQVSRILRNAGFNEVIR